MSSTNRYLDQESSFQGRYSNETFQSLYFSYRPMLARISVLLACGFVGRFLLLANANLIGIWVDSLCVFETGKCRPVPEFFAGFKDRDFLRLLLGVTVGGFLLTSTFRIFFSRLSAAAVSRFYDEVTYRTSRLPIQFFDTNPVGRIVTRFSSDYGNVFRLFGGPLAEFFSIVFDLICMIVLIAVASPYYLPIIGIIGAMNYVVYRLNRERLRRERRELSASRSPSIAHFAETTQGASSIRIFGRQATFLERFSKLNDRYLNQRLRTQRALLAFSMEMSVLTGLLLLSTGLAGYYMVQSGMVSVGSVGVAFTFIVFSGSSMQMFFEWFAQFEEAMTGVERLNDYLRRDLEPGAKLPAARDFETKHPTFSEAEELRSQTDRLVSERCAAVVVEDLWFRYGPELPFVLKGLNFQIRPGEKIGIVGRTGSGKSSFVQALFHLYPLERGRIVIGGQVPDVGLIGEGLSKADLGVFRRGVALISQEPTLFRGTLRENLDLTNVHSDERLIDALSRVGLKDWVFSQPRKLGTPIEERGRNLSAGEKQLLCMARCLLQDAPVIVMDEATSSIDPQSEEILVRATREFFADRTQIIIAHRLSTLSYCDRVLWLHQGEIKMFDRPSLVLPVFRRTELTSELSG